MLRGGRLLFRLHDALWATEGQGRPEVDPPRVIIACSKFHPSSHSFYRNAMLGASPNCDAEVEVFLKPKVPCLLGFEICISEGEEWEGVQIS